MTIGRMAVCFLACWIAVGCASTAPEAPKLIKIKHHKNYTRDQRFWAGESGDVQTFVLPFALVSPKKNQLLQEATKEDYTFFVVAVHHKTSNDALTEDNVTPAIRASIHDAPVTNVDAMAVVAPLVKNRLNELSEERNRLSREVVTSEESEAAPAKEKEAPAAPAPGAAKAGDQRAELTKIEDEINTLSGVRAYLHTGRLDTRRGAVWFQIMALPGKQDIAAIQSLQWGYGGGALVDLQEYGYKFGMVHKLTMKGVVERPVPSFLKSWFEQ